MKLNNKFALISVALMTGAACLTACSSDEVAENPNLSADGESVKTEFAINIPRAKSARMTAENTQANSNFLGMNDVTLIPIKKAKKDGLNDYTFTSTINLGNINAFTATENTETVNGGTKVYNNVSIPVGTKSFLFYAHAPISNTGTEVDKRFTSGFLTNNLGTVKDAASIEFALNNTKVAESEKKQSDHILNVLNEIHQVGGFSSNSNLQTTYNNFMKLSAGSAASVLATIEALYNTIHPWTLSNDQATKGVADAVISAIEKYFDKQGGTTATDAATLTWKQYDNKDVTYPRNINLPDGTAILKTENGDFAYAENDLTIGNNPSIDVNEITFPASLYYWVNADAKATSNVNETFPTTVSGWNFNDKWNNEVTATTQKIAIADVINYAVSSLQLKVQCVALTLPEHKFESQVTANTINVPDAGYSVTGVLIGGQPNKVGYNFHPSTTDFKKTIYDKKVNIKALANTYGDNNNVNYTLVLPNYNPQATTVEQKAVNFAIELTNDGEEFHGAGGQLIPSGGTFYLVGKLQPKETENDRFVFESDRKAVANVTITSLANAYNTIPDLRATNLSFGLAVDLDWEQGLQFDVEIGQ